MKAPLWIDEHAPSLAEFPQDDARQQLQRAVDEPMNIVVQGPEGVGKTAAVRALARETHANPETDLIELNVADFFDRTKKEIRSDPRFEPFLTGRSRMAKRDMINHVLKESAGYAPMSGSFKTISLDNAESIREDFQQALRRVIEQHHQTTQFVIVTRQPTKLIPPIRSRCLPVRMRAPTTDEIETVLRRIVEAEAATYDEEGLEYVAGYADGNLRQAILCAQATVVETDEISMNTAYETLGEVGHGDDLREVLSLADAGEFADARSGLDDLLDDGYGGEELLRELLRVARANYTGEQLARLHRLAGEIDVDLVEGSDDRIHLAHLLSAWSQRERTEANGRAEA